MTSSLTGVDMRLISNLVVLLLVIWTISMAVTATIGLTVYFPFVISETGDIPKHREESTRAGIMLTFAYYGVMHLFRRNIQVYPINFLITFLFNTIVAGLYIFFRHEYYRLGLNNCCFNFPISPV